MVKEMQLAFLNMIFNIIFIFYLMWRFSKEERNSFLFYVICGGFVKWKKYFEANDWTENVFLQKS